jgi:hypothetical protein
MRKTYFLGLLILLIVNRLPGQERGACFSFKEEKFNFGTVKEEDGPMNHVFEFTNIGGSPLIINNVQASCGCTTPDWSKQPVPPGGKGFVKATFDPSGRPGSFTKTITITSNVPDNPGITLSITGSVIGKPATADQQFRFPIDSLRFRSSHLGFQTLHPGMVKTDSLQFYNKSKSQVTIAAVNVPAFLKVMIVPTTLKPKEKGILIVTYNASLRNDWNFLVDYLYFIINGKQSPDYKITITSNIEEDFTKLSPDQLAKAPKIKFDKGIIEFGTIKAGEKPAYSFVFKNLGLSDLILRKIEKTCQCTTIVADKLIKAGGSGVIKVVFDTQGQSGSVNKALTITTNDPNNTKMVLYIRGTVIP